MDLRLFLEIILPYLFLFYLADCLEYIRGMHALLASRLWGGFSIRGSGLRLAGLLPGSWVILIHHLPVVYTRHGVYFWKESFEPQDRPLLSTDLSFCPFSRLADIRSDDRMVKGLGDNALRLPTTSWAQQIVATIREIMELDTDNRAVRLNSRLEESLDLVRLKIKRQEARRVLRKLTSAGWFLFLVLFVLTPLVVFNRNWDFDALPVGLFLVFCYFIVLFLTILNHRKLLPGDKDGLAHTVILMVLLPVEACHAVSKVTRGLFSGFDPLVLAAEFLHPDKVKPLLRRELLKARYIAEVDPDPDFAGYMSLRSNAILTLTSRLGFSEDDLLAAPASGQGSSELYCPLCLQTYLSGVSQCAECKVDLKGHGVESEPENLEPAQEDES